MATGRIYQWHSARKAIRQLSIQGGPKNGTIYWATPYILQLG